MSEQEAAGEPSANVYAEEETASESGAGEAATAVADSPVEEKPLFSGEELAQFDADDTHVGSVIGILLALCFLYTVVFTSLVAWWTFRAVG